MKLVAVVIVVATLVICTAGDDSEHARAKRQAATTTKKTTTPKPTTTKKTTTKKTTTPKPTTTKKTTTTKAPVCNKQNYDSLKGCCSGSVAGFFPVSEIQGCSQGAVDPKLQKFASYQMHTLYDNTNNIDLSKPATLKVMGQVPCVVECLFLKNGLLDANNNTNVSAAVAIFEKAASANWKTSNEVNSTESVSLMTEIVTQCANITDEFSPENVDVAITTTKTQNCLTGPGLLLQCIRQTVAEFCPPKLASTTAPCKNSLKTLETCGFFNTNITYKA